MRTEKMLLGPEVPKQWLCRQAVHESHLLMHHRGILWCNACGSWGATRLLGLAQPCVPIQWDVAGDKRHGRAALARLGQGLPPRRGLVWPDPA